MRGGRQRANAPWNEPSPPPPSSPTVPCENSGISSCSHTPRCPLPSAAIESDRTPGSTGKLRTLGREALACTPERIGNPQPEHRRAPTWLRPRPHHPHPPRRRSTPSLPRPPPSWPSAAARPPRTLAQQALRPAIPFPIFRQRVPRPPCSCPDLLWTIAMMTSRTARAAPASAAALSQPPSRVPPLRQALLPLLASPRLATAKLRLPHHHYARSHPCRHLLRTSSTHPRRHSCSHARRTSRRPLPRPIG